MSWAARSADKPVWITGKKDPVKEDGKSRQGMMELGEEDEAGSDGDFKS